MWGLGDEFLGDWVSDVIVFGSLGGYKLAVGEIAIHSGKSVSLEPLTSTLVIPSKIFQKALTVTHSELHWESVLVLQLLISPL